MTPTNSEREAERAAIVAYLGTMQSAMARAATFAHGKLKDNIEGGVLFCSDLRMAIERGDHMEATNET